MPNHYDVDIYCKDCGKYMFSYLYKEEDTGQRVCDKCVANQKESKNDKELD
jgi:hypothetical protein